MILLCMAVDVTSLGIEPSAVCNLTMNKAMTLPLTYTDPLKIWNKTYGGSQLDWGWGVQQTYDGGYLIAGETTSFGAGGYDAWLIKTDKNGCEEWNKTYGGRLKDGARSVLITRDSYIVLAGYTDSFGHGGVHDFWLIKTDSSGREVWNRTYGGSRSEAGFWWIILWMVGL